MICNIGQLEALVFIDHMCENIEYEIKIIKQYESEIAKLKLTNPDVDTNDYEYWINEHRIVTYKKDLVVMLNNFVEELDNYEAKYKTEYEMWGIIDIAKNILGDEKDD